MTETLRDELERDAARADHDSIEDGPAFARGVRYALAALARSESPSPAATPGDGLDVETLQYALEAVDPVAFALDGTAAATREQVDHFRYAHAIAAEYARLRSSADSGTEGT